MIPFSTCMVRRLVLSVMTIVLPGIHSGAALASKADEPVASVDWQTVGVEGRLPVFYQSMKGRLDFPLAWTRQQGMTFDQWKKAAQERVCASWLSVLPAGDFRPVIFDSQQRAGYTAHKVALNITADSRVLGYLLVPEGRGPFPAVLLLHDHGAEFRIGKEKMIRPWGIPSEKLELAEAWVEKNLGGRFVGDELARRGYVCFCTDALNWSDRGGGGYEEQQSLASNLMQMGVSYAGLIAQEDLRAAEFLATRPEVDSKRVAAMGFSMGSNRAWIVAAMSDQVTAGLCICSMASLPQLMEPDTNITRGQSSYTMLHPGLSLWLDTPDVASIACPKPMLFYNGRQDKIYPVPAVETAYTKLRAVWESQNASNRLETRLWDLPHTFNAETQEAALHWLARQWGENKSRE